MNPNRNKLMIASFLTLIAAGVGFSIRGAILGDWSAKFGFTKSELGAITGGGLVGFGVTIIVCSFILDKVGYKPMLILAFLLHVFSGVVTLLAQPIYDNFGRDATFSCLWWGMFLFALANGICEAVINPLIATIYPKKKTHYLNILHAGWPGGLIVGGLFAYLFAGSNAAISQLRWEIPIAMFLVPTLLYGWFVIKEDFPVSETDSAGITLSDMVKELAAPILLVLFLLHAMVGYVELGTDSWITNIMNNIIEGKAILLFIYTSALMFVLRFFAGPIVERINPVGLLMVSAALATVGLYMLGSTQTGLIIVLAATIYGLGKTFFWPTMLGVVGERFPRGGAVTMGMIGGIGMLSAGFLGGPGIGYKQDYYAAKKLAEDSQKTFDRYKSEQANRFLVFPEINGLDGIKVAVGTEREGKKATPGKTLQKEYALIQKQFDKLRKEDEEADYIVHCKKTSDGETLQKIAERHVKEFDGTFKTVNNEDKNYFYVATFKPSRVENLRKESEVKSTDRDDAVGRQFKMLTGTKKWWDEEAKETAISDAKLIDQANIQGGKMALKWTAVVPLTMFVGYLFLFVYFRSTGGYVAEHLEAVDKTTGPAADDESGPAPADSSGDVSGGDDGGNTAVE